MSHVERAITIPVARRPTTRAALVGGVTAVTAAAALALAFLPPLAAVWLVFGAGALLLILRRPQWGLYLLPPAVAFGDALALSVGGLNAGPTDFLFAALVASWLVSAAWASRADRRAGSAPSAPRLLSRLGDAVRADRLRAALYAALLVYLLVVVASLAVASSRPATLKEILKWGEVASLAPLAFWLLRDLARLRALAWAAVAMGVAEAALGFWQWALAGGDIHVESRVIGSFDQPNPYAGFLNLALPLAVALLFFSRDARERWMAGAAVALLAGAEVLARSRGGALGIAAALVVIAVVGWRREKLAAWALIVGTPLLAVAWAARVIPASLQATVLDQVRLDHLDDASLCSSVNNANFSALERQGHWIAGLRMFAAHPLLGVGAGDYAAAYAQYAPPCYPNALGHAHNYYINVAAETGILGLLAFLALTGATLAVGWIVARRAASGRADLLAGVFVAADDLRERRALRLALALGFLGAIIALTVHNATDDLFVHGMALQYAIYLGALLRLGRPGVLSGGGG